MLGDTEMNFSGWGLKTQLGQVLAVDAILSLDYLQFQ